MAQGVFQGENKTLVVRTNVDLTASIEIEYVVDTPTQIIKTLTGGGVTNVVASQFVVLIEPADTETTPAGNYKVQCRSTDAANLKTNGKFTPNKFTVLESVLTTLGSGNDYN